MTRKAGLLLALIGCLWATPASAVPTLIGTGVSAGSSGGTAITTGSYDTTGANFIIVAQATYQAFGVPAISENKGNGAPTALTSISVAGGSRLTLYYWVNPTTGSGHTFTSASTANQSYPAIAVMAFSGVDTVSPFDGEGTGGSGSGLTSLAVGSLTPSTAGDLVIAGLAFSASNAPSINSSFNTPLTQNFSAGNNFGVSISYLVHTSGALNPTWSWASATDANADQAAFKAAAGGGATSHPCPARSLMGVGCEVTPW